MRRAMALNGYIYASGTAHINAGYSGPALHAQAAIPATTTEDHACELYPSLLPRVDTPNRLCA